MQLLHSHYSRFCPSSVFSPCMWFDGSTIPVIPSVCTVIYQTKITRAQPEFLLSGKLDTNISCFPFCSLSFTHFPGSASSSVTRSARTLAPVGRSYDCSLFHWSTADRKCFTESRTVILHNFLVIIIIIPS